LEKDRPKVGKVTLRTAVGRVRGGNHDAGPPDGAREQRREAILSKSCGHRAQKQQLVGHSSSSANSGSGGRALMRI
jgi:hypothetical protein